MTNAMSSVDVISPEAPKSHIINGQSVAALSGKTFESYNPATGKVIARLAEGGAEDVDAAVQAARRAFDGPWSKWTPYQRQRLLMNVASLVEANFDELALIETLDMGAPIARTRNLKQSIVQVINYFAAQTMSISGETMHNSLPGAVTSMSLRAPIGVIGGIIPWNGPLISQWWVLGGTLATGCTLVLKPAEDASLSVIRMVELLYEAGLPEGVVNVVTGYGAVVGEALARHPGVDRVAFTGSTETGRRIINASTVNIKKLQLELGGKSPDIIFADADLDKAIPGAAMGVFSNSGQVCFAGTRIFVQRAIQDEFTAGIVAFTKTLKVGDTLNPETQLGPLISGKQLDRVLGYVKDAPDDGAVLACGGQRMGGELSGGYFIEPTVFSNVDNGMKIAREEIFGPVISIIPFDNAEEALALANDTEFGLGGAVWTRDMSTALQMVHGIKAGTVWVNCYGMIDPNVGFGGIKMSGYGIKGSRNHLDNYLYTKSVYINGG